MLVPFFVCIYTPALLPFISISSTLPTNPASKYTCHHDDAGPAAAVVVLLVLPLTPLANSILLTSTYFFKICAETVFV